MVPSQNGPAVDRAQCESRIAELSSRMRRLWIPGRRGRLVREWFDVGYAAREIGELDLMEASFREAIAMMRGRQPRRAKGSLAAFGHVAACHNLLGLRFLDDLRTADAAAHFDEAIRLRRELRRLFPKDRENEVYLGGALCNRGHASAKTDANEAARFYEESLAAIRQPQRMCECSYWDEQRQSWWCSQLEVYEQMIGLKWVGLAPRFIDNAMVGLRSLSQIRPIPRGVGEPDKPGG